MTLTDEHRIRHAWTEEMALNPFRYRLEYDPELEHGLHRDDPWTTGVAPDLSHRFFYELEVAPELEECALQHPMAKRVVMWDPSVSIGAGGRMLKGLSAAISVEFSTAIQDMEEWVEVEPAFYVVRATSGPDTILVDIPEIDNLPGGRTDEYHRVIEQLRSYGRPMVAEELLEMLRNIQEDPDHEVDIQVYSLQAMARFLIEHGEYTDPLAGHDPDGLMQIEWRIFGDGLLVMAFLEDEYIHCVAQAEPPDSDNALDISVELPMDQVAKEYGHLIPTR